MKAIICLGNPGNEYTNTRHNIGFKMADYLMNEHNVSIIKKECKSFTIKVDINKKKFLIVKPQTFMNLSGEAALKISQYYKIKPKDMLIIYDDSEINFGYIRFKKQGSAGTHNGMKSIINLLQTKEIARLRIGVGPIPEKWNIKDFVLANFSDKENEDLTKIFKESKIAIDHWLENDIEKSMGLLNKKNIIQSK